MVVLFFTMSVSAQEQDKNPEGALLPLLGYHEGKLLVARPGMPDPVFWRSVVLLVEHSEKGAIGLMVNGLSREVPLSTLFRDFGLRAPRDAGEADIRYGGPLSPGSGLVLHTREYKLDETHDVGENLALSPIGAVLRAIARGRRPMKSVFLVGHAGWRAGQLESEMRRGDWYMAPADSDILFGDDRESKWSRAMERRFRVM